MGPWVEIANYIPLGECSPSSSPIQWQKFLPNTSIHFELKPHSSSSSTSYAFSGMATGMERKEREFQGCSIPSGERRHSQAGSWSSGIGTESGGLRRMGNCWGDQQIKQIDKLIVPEFNSLHEELLLGLLPDGWLAGWLTIAAEWVEEVVVGLIYCYQSMISLSGSHRRVCIGLTSTSFLLPSPNFCSSSRLLGNPHLPSQPSTGEDGSLEMSWFWFQVGHSLSQSSS